ncbi:pyrroline-5-carboxylate reductase [Treponema parvum]|uniref:Pyrroline-5-carboxylate reductase n=1 Tax=Treponema parvum TaxID=138851 RepID=A0A975IDS3_9SPIR|nr:pyrroline-5-carboxylate reductase [Treponema parvum]QTQ13108.1 pyrroline-5-carboxylate reductase [Treponema parvum]
MKDIANITIGCIGAGTMGSALLKAMTKIIRPEKIFVSSLNFENAKKFSDETGCTVCKTNAEVASFSDFLFLGVKPSVVFQVLNEIKSSLRNSSVIISMAAGIPLEKLQTAAEGFSVMRIMPNMSALVEQAITALCCSADVSADDIEVVTKLLECAGKVENVSESLMDCVTGVSGSSPAFVFMFIEALADAAVRYGMPRQQAYVYAAQTVKGAASMVLEDGRCPAALKDAVCSPAGTTIEGVACLEKNGFRSAVIEAVSVVCDKAKNLSKK